VALIHWEYWGEDKPSFCICVSFSINNS